jgi:hypothetical protein
MTLQIRVVPLVGPAVGLVVQTKIGSVVWVDAVEYSVMVRPVLVEQDVGLPADSMVPVGFSHQKYVGIGGTTWMLAITRRCSPTPTPTRCHGIPKSARGSHERINDP